MNGRKPTQEEVKQSEAIIRRYFGSTAPSFLTRATNERGLTSSGGSYEITEWDADFLGGRVVTVSILTAEAERDNEATKFFYVRDFPGSSDYNGPAHRAAQRTALDYARNL